jgi:hypothetical protein
MRKILLLLLITASTGAKAQTYFQGRGLTYGPAITSTYTDTTSLQHRCDSLQKKIKDMLVIDKVRQLQAIRYARICQKNPKNLKYLAGWLKRAYE